MNQKERLSKKHPVLMCVLVALMMVTIVVVGNVLAARLHWYDENNHDGYYISITVANLINIIIALLLARREGEGFKLFHFKKPLDGSIRQVYYFIPLILDLLLALIPFGVQTDLKVKTILFLLFFTISIGFTEEMYFRGLFLHYMKSIGIRKAMIICSIIFGLVHLSTSLRGDDMILIVIPRIIFAFIFGLLASEIYMITQSIFPVILWHMLNDFLCYISNEMPIMTISGMSTFCFIMIVEFLKGLILGIMAILLWKKIK